MSNNSAVFEEPDITQALNILEPVVARLVKSFPICQFSTRRFIDLLLEDEESREAYDAAFQTFGLDRDSGLKVLHGQVIAAALRRQNSLTFAGFVHGDSRHMDPHSHSAWWRKEHA
jgi:hypothetical protein